MAVPETEILSPQAFVHIVLRTTAEQFGPMVAFYKQFLGAHAAYENEVISFLTYDDEHHRIAIVPLPETTPKAPKSCGLEHMAFSFKTINDLILSYKQKKKMGINPVWCVNHGPATSIYYEDPDGNKIETQFDNMPADKATEFMMSQEFSDNPIGVDFDPEELVRRVERGDDLASITKRRNIGIRTANDVI